MTKQRLDQLVLDQGLASNLKEAQALIMAGKVLVDDQRCDKPGKLYKVSQSLRLKGEPGGFVSRSGAKLAGAIEDFALGEAIQGAVCLDVGASTGGFTEALLQAGAKKVVAVDVGTNQMAWKLRQDDRVFVHENCDIRKFQTSEKFDVAVVDVSFIGLSDILDTILDLTMDHPCYYLMLIKPQFELPRDCVPKGGVVIDPADRQAAVDIVLKRLELAGIRSSQTLDSRVPGRAGNQEIFLYFSRNI